MGRSHLVGGHPVQWKGQVNRLHLPIADADAAAMVDIHLVSPSLGGWTIGALTRRALA